MKRRNVTAFVDWNSQIANAKQRGQAKVERQAALTAQFVAKKISELVEKIDSSADLFDVEMRLYYGWHRGLTPTPSRRALETLQNDRGLPSVEGKARFNWNSPFGDKLLNASDKRLNPKIRVHLPNTLRSGLDGDEDREKMVDTALVCDLLCHARSEPESIKLVLAEDDDIVPALYVSEWWGKDRGGQTFVARTRGGCAHLSMSGLVLDL